jgi:uncharacterized caspase-like protein
MSDSAQVKRCKAALVIGVNDYPDGNRLDWCVNDAQEIASVLTLPEYDFKVVQITDQEAKRTNMLEKIDGLFSSEAEIIVFFFAGHGCRTKLGTFLVTPDGTAIEPGISLDKLTRYVDAYSKPGRLTFIILDCCHSGAMAIPHCFINGDSLKPTDMTSSFASLPEGSVLLAACRPDEFVTEDRILSHGIFTNELIEGLLGKGANEDGKITPSSLHDYVSRSLTAIDLTDCRLARRPFWMQCTG